MKQLIKINHYFLIVISGLLTLTTEPAISGSGSDKAFQPAGVCSSETNITGMATSAGVANNLQASFYPYPVLTAYILADGRPCAIRIVASKHESEGTARLLVRLFDADERLVFWQYVEPGAFKMTARGNNCTNVEEKACPDVKRHEVFNEGTICIDPIFSQPCQGARVYQLRMVDECHNTKIEMYMERPLKFGVSGQNGTLTPWNNQREGYIYIPKDTKTVYISQYQIGKGRVLDENNLPLAELVSGKCAVIPVKTNDVVWKIELPAISWHTSLAAGGLPFILCPDAETARAIRASLEELPDGRFVHHKFQVRLWNIIQQLWKPEIVGTAEDLIVPLDPAAWQKDALRNKWLFGTYGFMTHIPRILQEQDTGNGRVDFGWPKQLAYAYNLDLPSNPYAGRQEILYRGAVAAFYALLRMDEDETFKENSFGPQDIDTQMRSYEGTMAFILGMEHLPEYAELAPHLPQDIRDAWTDAVRHTIDRHIPVNVIGAQNQSAHYLRAFWNFYRGSGISGYDKLGRQYARRFVNFQADAGYYYEAGGPDATYIGISDFYAADYFRMSNDPDMLESLRKVFSFYNHTVAPEPVTRDLSAGWQRRDYRKRLMAGFDSFNTRTRGSFDRAQYFGGWDMLADSLPGAAVWVPPGTLAEQEDAGKFIKQYISDLADAWYQGKYNRECAGDDMRFTYYRYYPQSPKSGQWPCEEKKSFTRIFGDELAAVKRPAYYAVFYVGHPSSPDWLERKTPYFRQLNQEEECKASNEAWHTCPFSSGGIGLFWTPEYGIAVSSRNWAPNAQHSVIATVAADTNDLRYWSDYSSNKYDLASDSSSLTVQGTIEQQPLEYKRKYSFLDNKLLYTLELRATADITFKRLVENIPFLSGPLAKGRKVNLSLSESKDSTILKRLVEQIPFLRKTLAKDQEMKVSLDKSPKSPVENNRITIQDDAGNGVTIELAQRRPITLFQDAMQYRDVYSSRAEIELPTVWKKGRLWKMEVEISPSKFKEKQSGEKETK